MSYLIFICGVIFFFLSVIMAMIADERDNDWIGMISGGFLIIAFFCLIIFFAQYDI